MHVVIVTTELASVNNPTGGFGSFTANIAHIYKEKGNQVSIILASTKKVDVIVDEGIELYSLYIPMKIWHIMDKIAIIAAYISKNTRDEIRRSIISRYKSIMVKRIVYKIHTNNAIDIIHCCHHISLRGLFKVNIPYIVRIAALRNIWKGATTPDGNIGYKENPINRKDKFEEKVIKESRYVVAPSYLLAGIVYENLGVNVTVIESPFVLKQQDWNYDILNQYSLDDKKYVIHYGKLHYIKGTHVVAKIAKRLLQNHHDLYLILAGNSNDMLDMDGNIIKAHELVKQGAGEYADRVIYVGQLVREQLYPLIQNAELCLLPSRIENLSNACIEAMAMGKIVVATNGASYEQLIDNGVNGFLCERDNPDSFLKGIETALALNEEEKSLMGSKAVETTKRLSPDNVYEKYLNFYKKVIREW